MSHPFAHLIQADGGYARATILRTAAESAQRALMYPMPGFPRLSYRAAFAHALRDVWAIAREARAALALPADVRARLDERASLIFGAQMIDETARSFSVRAAIEARHAQQADASHG